MPKKLTTEEFISKSKEVHNDLFGYDLVNYVNSKSHVEIFCKKHKGYFKQSAGGHLKGRGCNECGKKVSKKAMTTEQFIEKAVDIHDYVYDYSLVEYVNSTTKVKILCVAHNYLFFQIPNSHLNGSGCQKCGLVKKNKSRRKTQEQFIKDAKKIHGDEYNYSLAEYKGSDYSVIFLCKQHGRFNQVARDHLQGSGCPKCASLRSSGTYSRSEFIKKVNGKTCIFYTIRCFNNEEEFYKIGLTKNTVDIRYKSKYNMPYEYEVIKEIKGSAGFIWDLERDEKRKLKGLNYQPKIKFGGSKTECFTDYKLQ